MSQYIFKMPDLGEGTVEAEIIAWHTKPGDLVEEDQLIVEVMTDKAAVEVPAPVSGRVVSTNGQPGDKVAVGSPLIVFDLAEQAPASSDPVRAQRIRASPANRRRARDAGIDLTTIVGSGPGGRIVRGDLEASAADISAAPLVPVPRAPGVADSAAGAPGATPGAGGPRPGVGGSTPGAGGPAAAVSAGEALPPTTEIKVIGLRRLIAERMSESKRTIPHFAYVEEIDITELAALRQHLNARREESQPALTYLPFVMLALSRVLKSFPQCNVLYDAAREVLVRHRAVHVGVATQTTGGLKVPVVRNVQALTLWEIAAGIRTVSQRARSNEATREELMGSTITVTSLGKLGGIVSTPVINAPEVAIIGLNKAAERPVVRDGAVVVRLIMNLSSSFDHRFVDGYDAAAMIQALKDMLEHPATMFI